MEMKNYVDAVKILNEVIVKDEKYFKAYETLGIIDKAYILFEILASINQNVV